MAKLNEKVDELKKKMILDTASEYFKSFGQEKTQIDKISKDLSIGVGTIYGYFKSKEGLFLAWLQSIIDKAYIDLKNHCETSDEPVGKLKMIVEYKIKYIEKYGKDIYIHTKNRTHIIKQTTLIKINQMIDCEDLVMINRSYIVNLNYVEKIDKNRLFIFEQTSHFKISRSKRKEVLESYLKLLQR